MTDRTPKEMGDEIRRLVQAYAKARDNIQTKEAGAALVTAALSASRKVGAAIDALTQRLEAAEALAEQYRRDAELYRGLRDLKCNSLSLSRDGDHACNYMTASDWIDEHPEWYVDDDPGEVQRMRDTNTIWRLQVYPNTPVGFNVWNGSTPDAVIDAAIAKEQP